MPIRGEINGSWQRRLPDGSWRYYKNAYHQVLDCKNRFRNALIDVPTSFFPAGYVVFVSELPTGSKLTQGDFKVHIGDLGSFFKSLDTKKDNPWSLTTWREFALNLRLVKVFLPEAFDNQHIQLLRCYREGFISDYQVEASNYLFEDESETKAILENLYAGSGCFIKGSSGCGKTLAATYFSVELSKLGATVFFIRAKDYSGSLSDLLSKEIRLILDRDYRELIKAISRTQTELFFIVDGLNELSAEGLRQVLRGIKALARRYGAKILATSQTEPPVFLEALEKFEIGLPSENLKKRIAARAAPILTDAALGVLSVVHTGLEAHIVGEMQAKLKRNTSRLTLLDQYIRYRLGKNARSGSSGLRYFATYLLEKVSFSTSESEFDIRMLKNSFSVSDCDALFYSGILVNRSGRVSFAHDMFYYACASHSYAVDADNDPDAVGKMLNKPIYAPLAEDVISAIEDEQTVFSLIKHITNAKLLADAADGYLGKVAQSAAISLLDTVSESIMSDIQSAGLEIQNKDGVARLGWDSFTKVEFLPEECTQYQALGIRASRGTGVEGYLALCRAMDAQLVEERARIQEEASRAKLALKSESFRLAYLGFGTKTSFNLIAKTTKNHFKNRSNHDFPKFTSLSCFTKLPSNSSFFPQGEIKAFVQAIGFLAKYNYPLPIVEIIDERDYCFDAFRKIIYAIHSNQAEAKEVGNHAWQMFGEPFIHQAMVALYEIVVDGRVHNESKLIPSENILKVYPKDVLSLARQFIAFGQALDFSHSYRAEEATDFAFYLMGALGDRGDLGKLRELSKVSRLSSAALSAIKSIEEK